mmetsp:Transcript_91039/g.262448  ORF Transcript_91039/g.262448 Transcript_91039/m.262448 type:complete len:202 (+) Transcript_91039:1618-2223(+)
MAAALATATLASASVASARLARRPRRDGARGSASSRRHASRSSPRRSPGRAGSRCRTGAAPHSSSGRRRRRSKRAASRRPAGTGRRRAKPRAPRSSPGPCGLARPALSVSPARKRWRSRPWSSCRRSRSLTAPSLHQRPRLRPRRWDRRGPRCPDWRGTVPACPPSSRTRRSREGEAAASRWRAASGRNHPSTSRRSGSAR